LVFDDGVRESYKINAHVCVRFADECAESSHVSDYYGSEPDLTTTRYLTMFGPFRDFACGL